MIEAKTEPPGPPKLLGSLRLKARLAAASTAVLIAGALLAPRAAPTAVPASEERPVPLLEQELQRREPLRLFRPVREIARQIVIHNVTIPPIPHSYPRSVPDVTAGSERRIAPAGFGVFVDTTGTVLTHASALLGRSTLRVLTSDGASVEARVVAHDASTGLVLLRSTDRRTIVPAPFDDARAEPGSLAATAAQWLDRTIIAPVFVTGSGADSYTIDAHGAALAGMPLYNLDGKAFAIATGSAPGTAYPVRDVLDRLLARAAAGKAIDAALGVTFQALTPTLARVFHSTGALVTDVAPDGPAAAAGIAHGDVLTLIGTAAIDSPEAAQKAVAALAPKETISVVVVRGGRTLNLAVTAGSALDVSGRLQPPLRANFVSAREFLSTEEIGSLAISPDSAVLEINGRRVTNQDAARREWRRARRQKILYLEHSGARFYVALADTK